MLRLRVALSGLIQGPGVSTFHFVGTDQTTADAAADALATFWANLRLSLSTGLTYQLENEVAVVDETTGFQTGTLTVTPWSDASSNSSGLLPHATQGLIRWHTGRFSDNPVPGQPNREILGKTFIPMPAADQMENGRPDAGFLAAMQGSATGLINDADCVLAVWSKKHLDAAPVISGSPWNKFAVLRSRRD